MTPSAFKDYIKEMSESEKHAVRSNLILLPQHLLSRDYTTGTVLQYTGVGRPNLRLSLSFIKAHRKTEGLKASAQ